MNRIIHWPYTKEQKEEARKAMAAKVPQSKILEYFYPETSVEHMIKVRESFMA
jgi:type IV secretion system protein VirD4